jgi:hypothetical protein
MTSHELGTREQWAVAYAEPRAEEKDLTRAEGCPGCTFETEPTTWLVRSPVSRTAT